MSAERPVRKNRMDRAVDSIREIDAEMDKRQSMSDPVEEAIKSFTDELNAVEEESRRVVYPKQEEKKMDLDRTQELELVPKQKKKVWPIVLTIVLILILALGALLGAAFWYFNDCQKPVQDTPETVVFTVNPGDTVQDVTANLESAGLIKNAKMAYYYVRTKHLSDIVAGEFNLDKSWGVQKIFSLLDDPLAANQKNVYITIVEGDWAKHIAEKIAEVTDNSYDDMIALWNNKDWIRSMMPEYPFLTEEMFQDGVRIYLEGYLAPDTYEVKKDATPEEVTRTILDQTLEVYNKYKDKIANNPNELTIHEVYTLASIVQYEAGGHKETQELVASVFINRIYWQYPLQSSVTVCYAIDFDKNVDNWQACEINVDFESPYNTYKYDGLTPGPIENAGVDAIDSVLNAPETEYFFFMADVCGDGTVYFAETEQEHYANVAQYLTGCE